MLQMESIQKSRGYVSDILKLLCLLVEYFLEETALWLLCSGRYRRGGHEVDVQVFDSVAASTLVNRSAVQERSWWETKLNLCACLGGRYLATSTGAPYAALGGLWAIIIITVAEKSKDNFYFFKPFDQYEINLKSHLRCRVWCEVCVSCLGAEHKE